MILQVFSVFDSATKAYMPPFFSRSKGEALRSFTDACSDEKSNFNKHLSDYMLVHCGEFDDNSGVFSTVAPVKIIAGVELDIDVVTPFRRDNKIA
ncbi:MAG: nonstructural protein [Microviridae sp.]|nr:MAG: nonstructural protein [Microviridae sp.]